MSLVTFTQSEHGGIRADVSPVWWRETPSGLWFRCLRCGRLFPSSGRRCMTRWCHEEIECAAMKEKRDAR